MKWQESASVDLWSKRYVVMSPNWPPLCRSCSGLFNPLENFWFGVITWNNCSKVFEGSYTTMLLPLYFDLPLEVIDARQDTMVYEFMLSRLFCSQVNLWCQIPGCLAINKTAVASGGCAPRPPYINSFKEHSTADFKIDINLKKCVNDRLFVSSWT